MAKIDSIQMKTSDYSQEDLWRSIKGESIDGAKSQRLLPGEIVMRYTGVGYVIDMATGRPISEPGCTVRPGRPASDCYVVDQPEGVELWTLTEGGEATQIRLDLSGVLPEYDLNGNLANQSINALSDVDISSPAPSQVLTWDGLNWVNRDLPEFGGEGSIIPTLNEVGDVNYGQQAANNKFGPEQGDVLYYTYDFQLQRYVWAPYRLNIDLIDGLEQRDKDLVVDRTDFDSVTIGNPTVVSSGEIRFSRRAAVGTASLGAWINKIYSNTLNTSFGLVGKGAAFYLNDDIVLAEASVSDLDRFNGIKYADLNAVPNLPDDSYLASLKHVNDRINITPIGALSNVNDAGVLQGQVLGWDAIAQQYVPLSGVAPDLTIASIEDLSDVTGAGKLRGKPLTWNDNDREWKPERINSYDMVWDYNSGFATVNNGSEDGFPRETDALGNIIAGPGSDCPACDQYNLGRVVAVENIPYICLKTRSSQEPDLTGFPAGERNDTFGYVKILLDGVNRGPTGQYPPDEYKAAFGFATRNDPLALVAYEGSLGSLNNVSTADVFPGSSLVYNPDSQGFEQGYPALNLPAYSIGELGDVDARGAGVGYGLLWDGDKWVSSSLDQQLRLDDLSDVQFGSLGVQNTKLVAAYMMSPSTRLGSTFLPEKDVSTILAVSTPKADLNKGMTLLTEWSPSFGATAPTQGGAIFNDWRLNPPFTPAEWLDLYIRWGNDQSWQTIDGDGCIEIWFYYNLLLDNRTIFRKNSVLAGDGDYMLSLKQDASLQFIVNGAQGSGGFTINTPINTVEKDTWHHAAVVKDGTQCRLYFDGDLVGTAQSAVQWTGTGQFVLGRNDLDDNNTLTHNMFRGYMSDLRVTKGRPKYTGSSYTPPASLEDEIIDTTPNPGDFLSYDGTKWTNVSGVEGDISNKSINELQDVDTVTDNPQQGDALVWTGNKWVPGIPGLGATWSLNDMTDVSTFYQSSVPTVRFDVADAMVFSNVNIVNKEDDGFLKKDQLVTSGINRADGMTLAWNDCDWQCDPFSPSPCTGEYPGGPGGAGDINNLPAPGKYSQSNLSYIGVKEAGVINMKAPQIVLKNKYFDCSPASLEYHEDILYYESCPDRGPYSTGPGYADIPGEVDDRFVPCWGVIEDHIEEALEYGNLGALKNVSSTPPTLGQALAWTGTEWAPSSDIAADVSQNSIGDLADVQINGALAGQVLKYSGTSWENGTTLGDITELPDVTYQEIDNTLPVNTNFFRNPPADNQTSSSQGIHGNASSSMNIAESGLRGLTFGTKSGPSTTYRSHLYNMPNLSTVLTSVINPSSGSNVARETHIELSPFFIRFGGSGNYGSQDFRIGDNLIITYENTTRGLNAFGSYDVAPKGVLIDYIDTGLANLDLSNNILENLGNVDTAGKAPGYALVWDGGSWGASSSVAADISLSSIGDLIDVEKIEDQSITLDVPVLKTSQPENTNGGINLYSTDDNASFGWSTVNFGSPVVENRTATFSGQLGSFMRWNPLSISVQAASGMIYEVEPALSDLVIPSYRQVNQAIARQGTDYTALFFMDGNTFTERNYGWDLNIQVTTQPNPVYFSNFDGEYSLAFRKVSQDKIGWSTADGCPATWGMETLWAFEFWIYNDSTSAGDGYAELIIAPIGNSAGGSTSNAITFGLSGNDRTELWFSADTVNMSSSQTTVRPAGSRTIYSNINFDQWTHVCVQQEGQGRVRMYVNGARAGEFQTNTAINLNGGMTIGGRPLTTGAQTQGYLTAQLDDIRITRGWLPYTPDQLNIGIPVAPLQPGAYTANYGTLNSLDDVNTVSPAPQNGEVLMYDSIAQQWKPGPADQLSYDISSNVLSNLSDVDTTTAIPSEDDILRWNTVTDQWERSRVDGNGGVRPISARTATPGVLPQAGTLFAGEIFINMADKKAYTLDAGGQPFAFATASDVEGILDEIDAQITRVVGGTF